jgi:hypothetical protein
MSRFLVTIDEWLYGITVETVLQLLRDLFGG